jgi:hypothetical protein
MGDKSSTLDERLLKNMFINGDNFHLTSRFYKVELDQIQSFNNVVWPIEKVRNIIVFQQKKSC